MSTSCFSPNHDGTLFFIENTLFTTTTTTESDAARTMIITLTTAVAAFCRFSSPFIISLFDDLIFFSFCLLSFSLFRSRLSLFFQKRTDNSEFIHSLEGAVHWQLSTTSVLFCSVLSSLTVAVSSELSALIHSFSEVLLSAASAAVVFLKKERERERSWGNSTLVPGTLCFSVCVSVISPVTVGHLPVH